MYEFPYRIVGVHLNAISVVVVDAFSGDFVCDLPFFVNFL